MRYDTSRKLTSRRRAFFMSFRLRGTSHVCTWHEFRHLKIKTPPLRDRVASGCASSRDGSGTDDEWHGGGAGGGRAARGGAPWRPAAGRAFGCTGRRAARTARLARIRGPRRATPRRLPR